MVSLRSDSPDTTRRIAAAIAGLARPGDVVLLAGEMGAGKTAFAQGFGAAIGVTDHMTSPTYNLVHSHPIGPTGKLTLHHADVYRLSTQHEVADLALAELAESDGIVLVEWGDVVGASLGDHLLVRLDLDLSDDHPDDDPDDDPDDAAEPTRTISVSAVGRSWATRWDRLRTALEPFAC